MICLEQNSRANMHWKGEIWDRTAPKFAEV